MFSMLRSAVLSPRFALALVVATSCPAAAVAAPARAREAGPRPVQIASSAELQQRYPELVARIHGALDDRRDTDGGARVALGLRGASVVLTVVLPDGRSTQRTVSQIDEVLPALEALLVLPREPTQEPASTPSTATSAISPPAASTVDTPVLSARPLPGPTSAFRMELSLAAGARYGDAQEGARATLITTIVMARWLVGFHVVADRYETGAGTPASGELGLSLLVGRRLRLGTLALDLTAGPGVAVRGLVGRSSTTATGGATPIVEPVVDDGPWARLAGSVRLSFAATSFVRPFAVLDGDVTNLGSAGWRELTQDRLPRWTLGLGVGAAVGEP